MFSKTRRQFLTAVSTTRDPLSLSDILSDRLNIIHVLTCLNSSLVLSDKFSGGLQWEISQLGMANPKKFHKLN